MIYNQKYNKFKFLNVNNACQRYFIKIYKKNLNCSIMIYSIYFKNYIKKIKNVSMSLI